jgi:hypothetical protein
LRCVTVAELAAAPRPAVATTAGLFVSAPLLCHDGGRRTMLGFTGTRAAFLSEASTPH